MSLTLRCKYITTIHFIEQLSDAYGESLEKQKKLNILQVIQ